MIAENTYNRLLASEKENNRKKSYVASKERLNIRWGKIIGIGFLWYLIIMIVAQLFWYEQLNSSQTQGTYAALLCFLTLGGWGAIIIFSIVTAKQKQIDSYEKNKQWTENTVRQSKNELSRIQQAKPQLVSIINQCNDSLNKLYSLNIVHKKYCYFEACAMFLEYLSTNRTHSLEATPGDPGAYNMFEDELYKKVIVNKLDQVLSSQKLLYHELCNINENVNSLCDSMRRTELYSQSMAKSAQISAWCNTATAINTYAMRRMQEEYIRYR